MPCDRQKYTAAPGYSGDTQHDYQKRETFASRCRQLMHVLAWISQDGTFHVLRADLRR